MIRINNLKVSLDTKDYRQVISQQLNISKNKIKNVKLVKKAVDARRKNKVHFVCSFEFEIDNEEMIIKKYPKCLSFWMRSVHITRSASMWKSHRIW